LKNDQISTYMKTHPAEAKSFSGWTDGGRTVWQTDRH